MREIEQAFSVIAPDICGYGDFVDKKFNPICPTAHLLKYNGEHLKSIFKTKSKYLVRNIARLLGVIPEALQEFIYAWDTLVSAGKPKREAFDIALTSAEKKEDAYKARQDELATLREKANAPEYVNVLSTTTLPEGVRSYTDSIIFDLNDNQWQFKEIFTTS